MLLLWALISLLVAGSKVLPGVLLAASGIAVVVRQRLRMQEGKDQQRRAIQAGINKSIAVSDHDASSFLVTRERAGGASGSLDWALPCFPTLLSTYTNAAPPQSLALDPCPPCHGAVLFPRN